MHVRQTLLLSIVLVLGLCPLFGASITYDLNGTLGPNLNGGPDCLGGLNQTATASATTSSTATPKKTTTNTATYALPVGSVTASVGTISFSNTAAWSMKYTLSSTANLLTLSGPGPLGSTVTAVSKVAAGTFPKTVLGATGHPAPMNPAKEPQNLTQPSSYLSYSVGTGCPTTKLGFTGTIESNPAAPTAGK